MIKAFKEVKNLYSSQLVDQTIEQVVTTVDDPSPTCSTQQEPQQSKQISSTFENQSDIKDYLM